MTRHGLPQFLPAAPPLRPTLECASSPVSNAAHLPRAGNPHRHSRLIQRQFDVLTLLIAIGVIPTGALTITTSKTTSARPTTNRRPTQNSALLLPMAQPALAGFAYKEVSAGMPDLPSHCPRPQGRLPAGCLSQSLPPRARPFFQVIRRWERRCPSSICVPLQQLRLAPNRRRRVVSGSHLRPRVAGRFPAKYQAFEMIALPSAFLILVSISATSCFTSSTSPYIRKTLLVG